MEAALTPAQPRNHNALWLFTCLQVLDFATTMAVFAKGGYEGNPLVRSLMPFTGAVGAVLISKIALVLLTWKLSRRPWIIWTGNALYGTIVTWNALLAFLPIH
jgi:hypothetical protein